MRIGTSDFNGDTLELWDYGTPHVVMVVTTNYPRAFKTENLALKYNQDQADKGDPYGLLRVGERYRDGDGVPKDLDKARDYMTKAAAAGSTTAADELSKLNQVSTNLPATQ
jgi:TPR repeat protein